MWDLEAQKIQALFTRACSNTKTYRHNTGIVGLNIEFKELFFLQTVQVNRFENKFKHLVSLVYPTSESYQQTEDFIQFQNEFSFIKRGTWHIEYTLYM